MRACQGSRTNCKNIERTKTNQELQTDGSGINELVIGRLNFPCAYNHDTINIITDRTFERQSGKPNHHTNISLDNTVNTNHINN